MIAHMMRGQDRSERELLSTLFAVFFEPTRHLQMFREQLERQDIQRHTVNQAQAPTLRLGAIVGAVAILVE